VEKKGFPHPTWLDRNDKSWLVRGFDVQSSIPDTSVGLISSRIAKHLSQILWCSFIMICTRALKSMGCHHASSPAHQK
jgi:hypothetical protein